MRHDAWPSNVALLLVVDPLPFATSQVSSTLHYWWLNFLGVQDSWTRLWPDLRIVLPSRSISCLGWPISLFGAVHVRGLWAWKEGIVRNLPSKLRRGAES